MMAGAWKIQAFQQGASALQVLEKPDCQFHLALIDIGLPDISGIVWDLREVPEHILEEPRVLLKPHS